LPLRLKNEAFVLFMLMLNARQRKVVIRLTDEKILKVFKMDWLWPDTCILRKLKALCPALKECILPTLTSLEKNSQWF
jgi:hypothetical protein